MVREWSLESAETLQITNPDTQKTSRVQKKQPKILSFNSSHREKNMIEAYKYKQTNKRVIQLTVCRITSFHHSTTLTRVLINVKDLSMF